MPELTLGSLNLHMGRGAGGHDAPFYDVVAAAKEVDADVVVLQEAWVPDNADGNIIEIAGALGYEVAAEYSIARAECHDQVRLIDREGPGGNGDWRIAVLSRVPVESSTIAPLPQLRRDPARRALLVIDLDVDGTRFTVVGTHLPLLKDPVWKLRPAIRAALPSIAHPAAFAGDMNMWGWCIDRLVPRGWQRIVRGRTYPSHRPHSQTDHILTTPAVEIIEAEVVPQVLSDHCPVRARLRF